MELQSFAYRTLSLPRHSNKRQPVFTRRIELIGGLAWVLAGCLWCVTIIGIPVGLQCFKFASLAFFPFGKEVIYGGGGFSFLVNLIWIVFFGLEMAIGYVILGCLWCITLLGIPIGKQCFKMAKLSLMPFGAAVI